MKHAQCHSTFNPEWCLQITASIDPQARNQRDLVVMKMQHIDMFAFFVKAAANNHFTVNDYA